MDAKLSNTINTGTTAIVDRNRRLAAEFRDIKRSALFGAYVALEEDALDVWHVELHAEHFPDGSGLRSDIEALPQHGQKDHILIEIRFPVDYPTQPPFFRVTYPRFQWHTGHVSWGGSVCLEALVNTGSHTGYQSTYSVEGLLIMVIFNLTLDNPGAGVTPGRLDFQRARSPTRLDYSLQDARDHFTRIVQQHGWTKAPPLLPTTPASGAASTSTKPACKYAPNCYRKNIQHWAEFDHPGQTPPS